MEICEGLASLEVLVCSLHHFQSAACLSAFKCLKRLRLEVSADWLATEESLFTHLPSSSMDSIEHLTITIGVSHAIHWPIWITQFKECPRLSTLNCILFEFAGNNSLPHYLKQLPKSLRQLNVPPIPFSKPLKSEEQELAFCSSPEFIDCFQHFPKKLARLSFGYPLQHPSEPRSKPLMLSDDCFTHLPPKLVSLFLKNVVGITERLENVIPRSCKILRR
jgi:hypothetical protein